MRLADGRLPIRRDEIVNFLDFVSDIPELAGDPIRGPSCSQ
jgi:hypothetical protein